MCNARHSKRSDNQLQQHLRCSILNSDVLLQACTESVCSGLLPRHAMVVVVRFLKNKLGTAERWMASLLTSQQISVLDQVTVRRYNYCGQLAMNHTLRMNILLKVCGGRLKESSCRAWKHARGKLAVIHFGSIIQRFQLTPDHCNLPWKSREREYWKAFVLPLPRCATPAILSITIPPWLERGNAVRPRIPSQLRNAQYAVYLQRASPTHQTCYQG